MVIFFVRCCIAKHKGDDAINSEEMTTLIAEEKSTETISRVFVALIFIGILAYNQF